MTRRPARELGIGLSIACVLCACSPPSTDAVPVVGSAAATVATAVAPAATPSAPAPKVAAANTAGQSTDGIAWLQAATDADVDAAFTQARASHKPVFVYWGAAWCPPCNQVKATLFNRQDFIERSRAFVPVYVDGDRPGAQKLGTRFKVVGYPTMLLFGPDGTELTRLPGEVDAAQYTQVLTLGMNAQRPVRAVLADARQGGAGLSANDWKLLAFYSWETDEQRLVAAAQLASTLRQLAAACPREHGATATRLLLKSLAATEARGTGTNDDAARATLLQVLADPDRARTQMDVLTNAAPELMRAVSRRGTPQRAELLAAFDAALQHLSADASLSRADRMTALIGRIDLATIDRPKGQVHPSQAPADAAALSPDLLAEVREQSARADREITDGYERQAVITTAAYLLDRAGLGGEADALLKANLTRSHSPYYLMSALASHAKARGDKADALNWYEQAYATSVGPSTRLQWGASYLTALTELAPQDAPRIERVVLQLFGEAAAQPDAFYERSGRSLKQVASQLQGWNRQGRHGDVMARLQARLDQVCAGLPPADAQRSACAGLLKPGRAEVKTAV